MDADVPVGRAVVFRVGSDLYAVDVSAVQRVLRHVPARRMPRFPDWVEGLIEYEGSVLPVVDLRRRVSDTVEPVGARTRLLVIAVRDADRCAVVVDQVLDVRPWKPADLSPAPAMIRGLTGAFVKGLLADGDRLVVLLDLEALLTGLERRELESLAGSDA